MKTRTAIVYVKANNKEYEVVMKTGLKEFGENVTHFTCEGANMSQNFLDEDIPNLLVDLPGLIISEIEYRKKQDQVMRFRVSVEEKKAIMKMALKKGYKTASAFLRAISLEA